MSSAQGTGRQDTLWSQWLLWLPDRLRGCFHSCWLRLCSLFRGGLSISSMRRGWGVGRLPEGTFGKKTPGVWRSCRAWMRPQGPGSRPQESWGSSAAGPVLSLRVPSTQWYTMCRQSLLSQRCAAGGAGVQTAHGHRAGHLTVEQSTLRVEGQPCEPRRRYQHLQWGDKRVGAKTLGFGLSKSIQSTIFRPFQLSSFTFDFVLKGCLKYLKIFCGWDECYWTTVTVVTP